MKIPVVAIVVLAGALLLFGCQRSERIRYRITVEVETPDGLKTGSSVIESTITKGPRMGDSSGISSGLKGQAVAVDLGHGRILFATLADQRGSPDYHAHVFNEALTHGAEASPAMPRLYKAWEWAEERRTARRLKPTLTLPPEDYPPLGRFRDRHDPKSVELIAPEDLSRVYGAGVRLRRITLAVTDDQVTTGMEKWLPSFGPETGFTQWIRTLNYGDPRWRIVNGMGDVRRKP